MKVKKARIFYNHEMIRRPLLALAVLLAAAETSAQTAAPGIPDKVAAVAAHWTADYRENDRETYLENMARLQLVAGQNREARSTLRALHELRSAGHSALSPLASLPYEVYAGTKTRQAEEGSSFDQAFGAAFREIVGALSDAQSANEAQWMYGASLTRLDNEAREALHRLDDPTPLSQSEAIDVVRKVLAAEVYRTATPLIGPLFDEDDRRRYVVEQQLVPTTDGAQICTLVVRPRGAAAKLPALLDFTIYSGRYLPMFEARRTASHGYAGVEGFTRGKSCSPDQPVPIEHDGADAAAVIEWISRQPWSDGRVGMFGGSYEGFTQWAAAKHMPKALKAMMPSVTFAPGVDFPMDGNVFMNYAYPWPFYTMNTKGLDDATYGDQQRWDKLNHDWYASGRPYRDLDAIDGTPNPIFDRWLRHPSYDAYWKSVIPYGREFARIAIPVLTTTGYYDSGQIGALYYFAQHHRYRPGAEHYLLIGPYDHIGGQRGTISPVGRTTDTLRGYALDRVAQIDIGELRYQWFDYVFRGGPKPSLLRDKVNYEVMGANVWKHAPSLAAMSGRRVTFHLSNRREGKAFRLDRGQSKRVVFVRQTVDLADRSDIERIAHGEIIDQALDDWSIVGKAPKIANAIEFISDPFRHPMELSGLFAGRLDVVTNKKDFDFSVTLFELTPAGDYFQLSYYWARASFARDRSHRELLVPGRRMHLDFTSGRLTSRLLQAGSRLVVVLGVIKQPGEQINYGTGKDVSDESIADARDPLRILWMTDSSVAVPLRPTGPQSR